MLIRINTGLLIIDINRISLAKDESSSINSFFFRDKVNHLRDLSINIQSTNSRNCLKETF